jgi:subtilisin family serine protease
MKRFWVVFLAAIVTVAAALTGASPIATDDAPMIYLARATFDPLADEPAFDGPLAALREPAPDSDIYLVQFSGPVEDAWQADVEAAGVELLSYIPDHAFVARLNAISPDGARDLPNVRWVGPYRAAYKLEQSLDAAMQSDEPMALTISLFVGDDTAALEGAILSMDGAIEDVAYGEVVGHAIRVTLPASRIAELALRPEVAWIEPYAPMELSNDVARDIMGATGAQGAMSGLGVNLYGAGQIVSVADTGLDTGNRTTLSLDFRDNFVKAYSWGRPGVWSDPNGHGTHVAGSAAGSGRNSGAAPATHSYGGSFAGVAPEAGLIFQSILKADGSLEVPDDLKQLFTPPHNDGARIHTNSWGHRTGGTSTNPTWGAYDSSSRYTDEFMWLNPTSLVLFSAGNNGIDANADGVIDLDQIGAPGTAKNVLTVGATETNRPPGSGFGGYTNDPWGIGSWLAKYPVDPIRSDYTSDDPRGLAAFSSRGPTDDGRTKPDVVAPGTDIISSRSHASGASTGWGTYNADYIYNGGTSMSTPLTAGAATLVRQFYVDHKSHANPSAALVKATIINGAANIAPGQYGAGATQEIPNSTPNNVTGFGRVNLLNSMGLNANESILFWDHTAGLSTGGRETYSASVSQAVGGSQFSATVCWTDYPGTVGAGKALINDLDLEVVTPTGARHKGNGKAIWDRYNPCERVTLNNPVVGTYELIVNAYSAPHGPQPFALIVQSEHLSSGPVSPLDPAAWLPLIMKAHGGPPAMATPTVTTQPAGWTNITTQNFDGAFPGSWNVYDRDGYDNGEYLWGKRNCQPVSGQYSGWAVGAGASGMLKSCGDNYPNNADSWMVYGPFSLANATDAELLYKLWLDSESNYDKLCYYASINGNNWYGRCAWGNSQGWLDRELDLTDVYILGDITGSPQVWVAFKFESDSSINYPEGAYVDNIVLRKYVSAAAGAQPRPADATPEPAGGDFVDAPSSEEFSIK